jgi:hypothetical protein
MYVGIFAAGAVAAVLVRVVPAILNYVGAYGAARQVVGLAATGLAIGGAIALPWPRRDVPATVLALCGPGLLAIWFALKESSHPTYVSVLMSTAFVPLGMVLVGGIRTASGLIAGIVGVAGLASGWGFSRWLVRTSGPEATWLIAAAIIATAALALRPCGRAKWQWVIAFIAAPTAAMLAAIQITTAPMRLEYHLHTPNFLERGDR